MTCWAVAVYAPKRSEGGSEGGWITFRTKCGSRGTAHRVGVCPYDRACRCVRFQAPSSHAAPRLRLPGRCRLTSATATSSTRCDTPSCRRAGSKTSGDDRIRLADRRHRGGWYHRSGTLYLWTLGFRTAVMAGGLDLRWLSNQRLGANAKRIGADPVRDAISSTPFRSQRSERCF